MNINKSPLVQTQPLRQKSIHPLEDLAAAIVLRAVEDYKLIKKGRIPTKSEEEQINMESNEVAALLYSEKKDIIDFFHSPVFGLYTRIDPGKLLKSLDERKYNKWTPRFEYLRLKIKRLETEIKKDGIEEVCKVTGHKQGWLEKLLKKDGRFVKASSIRQLEKKLSLRKNTLVYSDKQYARYKESIEKRKKLEAEQAEKAAKEKAEAKKKKDAEKAIKKRLARIIAKYKEYPELLKNVEVENGSV